jgi:CBS domain-containing protein
MDSVRVGDRMTSPAVTAAPEASVTVLVAMLRLRKISAVPVVDAGNLVGIVSTTDLVRASALASARDVMSSPVLVASADDPIDEAGRRMGAGRIHRLVVVDEGHVSGVLSARDVLEGLRDRKVTEPVGTAMTTPVETIEIGETVEDAVIRLRQTNVHGLVVVDGSSPVGVFTHTEALAVKKLPPSLRARPVEDVMSYETICLDVGTPIFRAAAYSLAMNVRRILVVDHRQLVGIVSSIDLVDVLSRAPAEAAP